MKCAKTHLKHVVSSVNLTFEEFRTVLTQVEDCLNSCPLTPVDSPDNDSMSVLTPGHLLIGMALTSLPDPEMSYRSVSLLKCWHLCQNLVRHFWEHWCNEYLCTLNKYNKWRFPSRNVTVGDYIIVQERGTIPTKWPLGCVTEVHLGHENMVHVVTVKPSQ